jgi:enamine deaminase RidA (YjgF/YER057c/UK114 family)
VSDLPNKPLGAYSPIRVVDLGVARMVFVSGLTARPDAAPDTGQQARAIFATMRALLAGVGGDLRHVVKLGAFLTDMDDYGAYNVVRNEVFGGLAEPPASATVGTSRLVRPGCLIEIEAVAVIPR